MAIKRDPLDAVFSNCIRERANYICECCGVDYRHRPQGLHCSHFFGRRAKSVRWEPLNAAAHCYACHQRLGANPIDFARWIENYLGEEKHGILIEKKNTLIKLTAKDKAEMRKFYQGELEVMQKKRADGEMGRIEFVGWL